MEAGQPTSESAPDRGPHFTAEAETDPVLAWEQIDVGRYMPRRVRGSFRGRALG